MMGVHLRGSFRLLLRAYLILTIALPQSLLISAYPNWMKCYIELSNTERVMGAEILEFEDTRYKLHVEIKGPDDLTWSHHSKYEYDGPTTVKARLRVPQAMEGTSIMFVMESTPGATLDPSMCNGKRSFGREWDSEITVKIDGIQDSIELLAGWARGFEPVKLTKRIVLWKKGVRKGDVEEDEDEDDEDYDEDFYEAVYEDDGIDNDDEEDEDDDEEDDEDEDEDDDDEIESNSEL